MTKQLGRGTFGCVKQGSWVSKGGSMPVAIKVIQDNSEAFDLSDLRGEVISLISTRFEANIQPSLWHCHY